MKIKFLIWALLISSIGKGQELQDQRMKTATNGSPEDKKQLIAKLYEELKSYKTEKEYRNARYVFYAAGQEETADSLNKVAIKKFPKGAAARDAFLNDVYYKQEKVDDKAKIYKELIKKWPADKFPGDEISYDYVIANLATSMAEEDRPEEAKKYLANLHERFWRGNAFIPVGVIFLSKGDTTAAISLLQTAVDDAYYYLTLPEDQKDNKAKFAAQSYTGALSSLVNVFADQGKNEEALKLIEQAIEIAPQQSGNLSYVYSKCLIGVGRNLEAFNELSKLYKDGRFDLEPKIKEVYLKLNGSDKGLNRHLNGLQEELLVKIREHIKTLEQHKQAPAFDLVNLKGERVSLESLKGKVVVLDFWATWCQPCKKSFPGMKAAQEFYQKDEDVVFLFVNTWERDKNYKENVAAFIEKNNYPFNVLFDDVKDPATNEVLAAKFGIKGIPAKFIIDKEGYIRYALLGSSPMVDYIKLEMKELVEGAKKPYKG